VFSSCIKGDGTGEYKEGRKDLKLESESGVRNENKKGRDNKREGTNGGNNER
jgi:hypothetical protein